MMMIVKCACGTRLKAPATLLGKVVVCGACRGNIRIVAGEPLSSDDRPIAHLIVQRPAARAGEQIILAGGATIEVGSLASRHLRLAGEHVGRLHCTLSPQSGGWRIDDARSALGTYVNGSRITAHSLHDGDLLDIGDFELRFVQPLVPPPIPREEPRIPIASASRPAHDPAPSTASNQDDDAIPFHQDDPIDFEPLTPSPPSPSPPSSPPPVESTDAPDDLYDFAEPLAPTQRIMPAIPIPVDAEPAPEWSDPSPVGHSTPPPLPSRGLAPATPRTGGPICPSCDESLAPNATICVACGIRLPSGRPLITAKGLDEDDLAIRADTWIRITSWIIPIGLFPIASEAYGTRKPIATWTIAIVTALASVLFFVAMISTDHPSAALLNLMNWRGTPEATVSVFDQLQKMDEDFDPDDLPPETRQALEAYYRAEMGYPEGVGFRWRQLLTSALLHGGPMHLAGNLLFLLVFGLRVNELIGNMKMAILYPLLAIISAAIDMLANAHGPLTPALGASGAIMGLAGMYFVFFPVQRVHMAIWFRGGIFTGWRCFYKLFKMHGFWLLLLWIGLNDILPTLLGSDDNVAHWAHLGGFAGGMLAALTLMISRLTNARGADALSVTLGKHAWPLLGKPSQWKNELPTPRAVSMNYPG